MGTIILIRVGVGVLAGMGSDASSPPPQRTVGDCLTGTIEKDVDVAEVTCTSPHDFEVFALESVDGATDTYPGEDVLDGVGSEDCVADFADYTGDLVQESDLDIAWLIPTKDLWQITTSRQVVCLASDPSHRLTNSVRATAPVTLTDEVALSAISVGDCFQVPDSNEVVLAVTAVPCARPHDREVFHVFDGPDEYPGTSGMDQLSADGCMAAFEPYVGIQFEKSPLDVFWLAPTDATYALGDREVICVLGMNGSKISGSRRSR